MLYSAFEGHERAESSSRGVDMWLSTNRPILFQSKARAMEFRRVQRKEARKKKRREEEQARQPREAAATESSNSDQSDWNAGYSSADSAGDVDSVGSMILDPGDDIFDLLE